MTTLNSYTDIYENILDLSELDAEERDLCQELQAQAKAHPDFDTAEFFNYWMPRVGKFYEQRGLTRRQTIATVPWKIAQDLNSRQMVKAGRARLGGDYRDELLRLIVTKFGSRRAFCEATGLSEDMLSHVLAKRKNLGIQTLAEALGKIGYTLRIEQSQR